MANLKNDQKLICKKCGSDLGCWIPCWVCGGEGMIDEGDFLDVGFGTPWKMIVCGCCNDGEIYDPHFCPRCDIEETERDLSNDY